MRRFFHWLLILPCAAILLWGHALWSHPHGKAIPRQGQAPSPVKEALPPSFIENPAQEALKLVYAYRPEGCEKYNVRELLAPLIEASSKSLWSISPQGRAYHVTLGPYGGSFGPTLAYDFEVNVGERTVKVSPETARALRTDVLARLAADSDLQGFRKFLDFGG